MESAWGGRVLWSLSSFSHYVIFLSNPSGPFLSHTCIDFSLPLYYHLICRILRFVTWELGTHTSNSVFFIYTIVTCEKSLINSI